MSNWHVYIFLATVWEEITKQDEDGNAQYALPSNRRATQSADGVYTQIVGELTEEIATQSLKDFCVTRKSKEELDEWKTEVGFHASEEF